MDPENGSEHEFDNLEASEEDDDLDALEEDADPEAETEDTDPEAEAEEDAVSPSPSAEDDLPTFTDSGLSEAERQQFTAGLGDEPLAVIEAMIDRRVAARLASVTHANIHLQRAAQEEPELYRLYGAQTQSMLSQMTPEVAASKQGVQMATLGAIARKVNKTGDLRGAILEAAAALQKPTAARTQKPLPPEARTPSPTVGKRPQSGSRGNGRASAERVVDALAEMTGTSSRAARRYFEEGD